MNTQEEIRNEFEILKAATGKIIMLGRPQGRALSLEYGVGDNASEELKARFNHYETEIKKFKEPQIGDKFKTDIPGFEEIVYTGFSMVTKVEFRKWLGDYPHWSEPLFDELPQETIITPIVKGK